MLALMASESSRRSFTSSAVSGPGTIGRSSIWRDLNPVMSAPCTLARAAVLQASLSPVTPPADTSYSFTSRETNPAVRISGSRRARSERARRRDSVVVVQATRSTIRINGIALRRKEAPGGEPDRMRTTILHLCGCDQDEAPTRGCLTDTAGPGLLRASAHPGVAPATAHRRDSWVRRGAQERSEEHTSELQ